jgi:sugar lactone lactonase YvrE
MWLRGVLPLLAILLLSAFGIAAQAQTLAPSWYQQAPVNSPSARLNQVMAYDAGHQQVVLFSGNGLADTWLWNGTNWTQASPATSPSARTASTMAYDALHGQVVMFGGADTSNNRLNDTWLWNGTTWTQANPGTIPPGRNAASMVYDPVHQEVVLFGGINASGFALNDTWLWNGTTWTQVRPATSPSARSGQRMAYDAASGQVLLFGGEYGGAYLGDTWVWDGTTWTQQTPSASPSARYEMGMDYDAALGQVVLFGGEGAAYDNDTWLWNGSTWTQYIPTASPAVRLMNQAMVYDAARSQILFFGGGDFNNNPAADADTWEFGVPGNFGQVNVCPSFQSSPAPCSKTISFTYTLPATPVFGTPQIVTQGVSGLDFALAAGNTCTGAITASTCTVNVTFTPLAPGLRTGAINLVDGNGSLLTSTAIYGVGEAPAVAIGPGTRSNVNTTASYPLNQPKGVTIDAAGDIFIADNGHQRVVELAANGSASTIGVGLNYPQGLAVDGAGDLFIADNNLNEIVKVPAGCTLSACQTTVGVGLAAQLGVAVDGAGNVFAGDFTQHHVVEIPVGCTASACQNVVYSPGTTSNPVGIALDAAGDLFVADFGLAQVVEVPAGCTNSACQVTVGQGWVQPEAVAVDAAGNVFVADESLDEVIEVPANCTVSSCQTIVLSGVRPIGVALDAKGNIFVPDLFTNQLIEVNRSQPPALTFATTNVGSTSSDSPQSISLQNIGNQQLNAESPGLLTVNGPNFVNVAGSGAIPDCSATASLIPGAACNVSIGFTPQTSRSNFLTSTATFSDNALNAVSGTQVVQLSGTSIGAVYTVGGTVSGLTGVGLVLADNLGDNLPLSANGSFTFATTLSSGSPYSVTVFTQPIGQVCTVTNGSGTIASANITNVQVSCVNLVSYPMTVTEAGTGTGTVTDNQSQISCAGASGGTKGTCSGSYLSGTQVTLTANPTGSTIFVGWGGACSSSGTNATCTVTLTSALTVSASFVAPPATQPATLKPITAGIVYGQGGSFTSNAANNGGISASSFARTNSVVVDASGNLYVGDGNNNRVLFFPQGSTTATRVYGQGGIFTTGDVNHGGISANSFNNPEGLALDSSGNLYVADEYNNRVLFFPAGSTTATRVYGQPSLTTNSQNNGGVSANSLFTPLGIALDGSGNLYVADFGNSRVLFYPAGSTTATRVYGQGGSFTTNTPNNGGISANSLNQPAAVALDSSGDLYVADIYNNRVLFYPANSTTATQVYGQGGSFSSGTANNGGVNAGTLDNPLALTVDSNGNLYVVDRSNNRVLYYPFGSGNATRVYGQGGSFNSSSAGITANSLNHPWGVALDQSGNVYIADYDNNRVLEYGSFGNVNVCPGTQGTPAPCNTTITMSYAPAANTTFGATKVVTQGVTGLDFTLGTSNTCVGTVYEGTACTVNVNFTPLAPGLRAGAVELFDNAGNQLTTTPVYGFGQGPVVAFGDANQVNVGSGLANPVGLAVDAAGDLFIGDYGNQRVVELTAGGNQITIASGLNYPEGVAVDGAGNVYIADSDNNRVLKVAPGGGAQTTVGSGLHNPTGVAVDGAGNVFIADYHNNRVVEVPAGGGPQTTVGSGLNVPQAVAVDGLGNVYIADSGDNQVVKVTASGVQTTLPASGLSDPIAVAVDAAGDVFIGNYNNNNLVELSPSGVQTTVPATGLGGRILGVAADGAGNIFLSDFDNNRVVAVNRSQVPSLNFALTNVGSASSDSPQSVSIQNVGNLPLTGSLALNLGGSFTQSASVDCTTAFPLAPGASCGESFSFIPQSATFFSGTAAFTDNTSNLSPAATQTITLSGTGAVAGAAGTVAVPNVVGQTQTASSAPIAAVGLVTGTVSTTSSSTVPSGTIISQNPAAGTQVTVGSAVNLLVSSGIAQPTSPSPLSLNNNYFLTGDYVSAGVTLRGTGVGGLATGSITIPSYTQSATQGVPDGADIIDAFLYWETIENTATASSTNGTFNGYSITGQQIGTDIPNYVDGKLTGTLRAYRADVNLYLPIGANGVRFASGNYSVALPDSGGSSLPLTEGASLVILYRVLSPNFPLKSIVIYDGAGQLTAPGNQVVQGFYDAVGGGSGTGKATTLSASAGTWNNSVNTAVTLGQSNQYSAPLAAGNAYAAVILSTPVNNSDNDGILDAWKTGPGAGDFHAGQPGYYDVKTGTWVGLPGAKHGQKDLFVQLDYMCGAILASGACDPTQENLFPSPDANGQDPLAMVQQAFAQSGVQLHLQVGNAIPESTCVDSSAGLCQFPNQPGVIGWKNSLEFSKLYPRNLAACITGGDCTTRFPFGQKDSYHYVLFGHSLAIPAYNTRFGTLTSINVVNGVTTLGTIQGGVGGNACPSRITIAGVLGNPALNGVYNTSGCPDAQTVTVPTPGVPNWSYPNNTLAEPVIGVTSGTITSISGYSDLGGSDSAVTLGLWLTAPNQDMSKRANVIAGTLFHEIGHTLGLSHGGLYYDTPNSYVPTFDANCKPNYQSVMNYLFQLDLLGPNKSLAFSNQTLNSINENAAGSITQLTDPANNPATFPTSAWYVPYTTGSLATPATLHCDGTPLNGESGYRVDSSIAPITPAWSNGQDLSFIGTIQSNERGFNDLTNLDLRQVGATGGEFASLASLLSFGSSSAPLNISAGGTVALGSGGTVALGSGGTVALGSGGTVTLGSGGTVTLGSGGTVTLGSGGNVTVPSGAMVAAGSSGVVALGSGGTVTLGSGGTVTLGSGGTVTLGSGGTVTLGSGGTIALGSGGSVTIPSSGGSYTIDGSGGVVTLGSGGTVALGSGGTVTLGSGGVVALGSGGTVTLGSGGVVTLGSGGTVTLGSGGTVALGSGGTVALGSGGVVALGSGGVVALGSGGTVTLGSGGTVTLGSGGSLTGSGGNVTLGSGGQATLGAGGTVTLGSGGTVTLGSGGNVTLGSGGTVTLGSGGVVTLGSGGTVTLGSGGTVTLGSGGTPITVGAGGTVTLGSGGTVTLGSGGTVTLGSGGNLSLSSGGTVALGSGGVVTLGSGGTVTLGSGGVVTLGSGGSVTLGSGSSSTSLASVPHTTPGSGGPTTTELSYETANSVVRPPTSPTETSTPAGVLVTWQAPLFGVVQTYTVYRSSNGATPIVIGSVSGVNGNPPATQFLDTNPDLVSQTVIYTITTTLVPDTAGPSRSSAQSPPAVLKNNQSIVLGPLPSSVTLNNPPTVTATATSAGVPNGLQVTFSATGSCTIGSQSLANNVSSATVTLATTGSCTVTASQPGTTTFNAANSVSGTFTILPQGSGTQSQTITFAPLPNAQYGGSFSLSASSSAGLPVTFSASGPCTTSGTISGVGLCSITASAAGNSSYSAATLTQSFTIYPAVLKVTATSLSSVYGQPLPALTYSLTGFIPGDTAAVVSGAPALSTTATATSNAGTYPITVSTGTLAATNYSFLYVSGTLTVQPANQSALTLKTVSPLTYNQSETLSVSGGTTNGAVTYNLINGPCTLAGSQLTATSGTGACQVTATMAGNSNYNAVTSLPANVVTLSLANQAISFTTNPPATAATLSSFTVVATATSGGAVTFTSAGSCSNNGATYKITGAGSCSVIANQGGNSNYAAALQVTKTVSTTLLTPVVTWANPPSIVYGTPTSAAQQTATVTGSGGVTLPGSFVYTQPNGVVLSAGTHPLGLAFTPTDTADYAPVSAYAYLTVTKATPLVTWANPPSIVYGTPTSAAQQTATATGVGGTNLPGTYFYTQPNGTILKVGTYPLGVAFTPTDSTDYVQASGFATLTVTKATPTVTWNAPGAITTITPLSATQLNATASVPGTFVYSPAAGATLPLGPQTLSVTFTPTDSTDYAPVTKTVPIQVNLPVINISLGVSSGTQTYPTWTNFVIAPAIVGGKIPTGTVTLYDNGNPVTTLTLDYGVGYYTAQPFNVGSNSLTVVYSGDRNYPAGISAATVLTVLPAPVRLQASCWGATFWTVAYQCTVNVSAATSTPPTGTIAYSLDGAAPVSVALSGGNAAFTVGTLPAPGNHKLTISYAGQGNYAAAPTLTETFTTQPGQTEIHVTPSSYSLAAGSPLTLSATLATPISGVPTGSVAFYDGSTLLGTSSVGTNGAASYTVSKIARGTHLYYAVYAATADYGGATSATALVLGY